MGCHTDPATVHIAHVLQRLHFFQFFNFLGVVGEKQGAVVHRGIKTVFSSCTRSKAFSGRYWYCARSDAAIPMKLSRNFCSKVRCARR